MFYIRSFYKYERMLIKNNQKYRALGLFFFRFTYFIIKRVFLLFFTTIILKSFIHITESSRYLRTSFGHLETPSKEKLEIIYDLYLLESYKVNGSLFRFFRKPYKMVNYFFFTLKTSFLLSKRAGTIVILTGILPPKGFDKIFLGHVINKKQRMNNDNHILQTFIHDDYDENNKWAINYTFEIITLEDIFPAIFSLDRNILLTSSKKELRLLLNNFMNKITPKAKFFIPNIISITGPHASFLPIITYVLFIIVINHISAIVIVNFLRNLSLKKYDKFKFYLSHYNNIHRYIKIILISMISNSFSNFLFGIFSALFFCFLIILPEKIEFYISFLEVNFSKPSLKFVVANSKNYPFYDIFKNFFLRDFLFNHCDKFFSSILTDSRFLLIVIGTYLVNDIMHFKASEFNSMSKCHTNSFVFFLVLISLIIESFNFLFRILCYSILQEDYINNSYLIDLVTFFVIFPNKLKNINFKFYNSIRTWLNLTKKVDGIIFLINNESNI